jgi:hypothetical protein
MLELETTRIMCIIKPNYVKCGRLFRRANAKNQFKTNFLIFFVNFVYKYLKKLACFQLGTRAKIYDSGAL